MVETQRLSIDRLVCFDSEPSRLDLERFFFLDDEDRRLIDKRRGNHNRLGFALQLTTVRYVGAFLPDPLEVPWSVVDYLAGQLLIADAATSDPLMPGRLRGLQVVQAGTRFSELEPDYAPLRATADVA